MDFVLEISSNPALDATYTDELGNVVEAEVDPIPFDSGAGGEF